MSAQDIKNPAPKPAFVPIRVSQDAIEAYRKTQPLFTEFLIETGRVIIENMPGQLAGAQEYGKHNASP